MITWDWHFASKALFELLIAFGEVTLPATVLSSLFAALLGLGFAIVLRLRVPVLSQAVSVFVSFIRNTPLLVQLYFLFFVLPSVGIVLNAFFVGIVGLGIHFATYYSEVYRAGVESIPRGQWDACTALSMPRRYVWQHVVLPQVFRNVLPALGNYAITMFKETPLLSAITVVEMVATAQNLGSATFRYLEPLTLAGLIFLAASYPTAIALRRIERVLERTQP